MKPIFFLCLVFSSACLFAAAPLQGGFASAPAASASQQEKDLVFFQARNKVLEAAMLYENIPYRYGGTTRSGLDCSGLIHISFKDALGVSTPRTTSGLYTWAEKISLDKAQPGDLLFFKTDGSGRISHVGFYLGDRRFIHAASEGLKTGVIYSTLDETYWARAYASAGRILPATPEGYAPSIADENLSDKGSAASAGSEDAEDAVPSESWGGAIAEPPKAASVSSAEKGRLLIGAAVAPTWNGFLKGGDLFRGVAGQLRVGAETYTFGTRMVFGLELRPEYDGALGVFRLPITLSWGPSDKISIFAGPVFSFGEAVLSTPDGERHYSGGTNWLGAIGLTAAPFSYKSAAGEFSPYIEAAWQYYFSDNESKNLNADFSAGFRFSTGIRWTMQVR